MSFTSYPHHSYSYHPHHWSYERQGEEADPLIFLLSIGTRPNLDFGNSVSRDKRKLGGIERWCVHFGRSGSDINDWDDCFGGGGDDRIRKEELYVHD